MIFKGEGGRRANVDQLFKAFGQFVAKKPEKKYKIIIGTDSMTRVGRIKYVTAIILQRIGNGGIVFFHTRYKSEVSLYEKLMTEVSFSIEVANNIIIPECLKRNFIYPIEIHIDIGEQGKSFNFQNQAIGYAKGCGFNDKEIKIKPYAFGATSVADRYTR
ncbi:MAG: ribonuclease H-like YkuK family protein [Clostridia bacterium]|nr:ribonuclease H-like YkuK family protein [Clostridia bacterium]